MLIEFAGGLAVFGALVLLSGVRRVKEYDRLVVFRFGRVHSERGPGLNLVVPLIERAEKVDLRIITMPIPPQDGMTKDNIPVRVTAVCFFRVVEPKKVVTGVQNVMNATSQIAQTTLRSMVGHYEFDQILSSRDKINAQLLALINEQTLDWGITISSVAIKDVELPTTMKRAMAKQAEAERLRRAKVVAAEGEMQAAQKLAQAAEAITAAPGAMRLRQLQSMAEVSIKQNKTYLVPIPMEFIEMLRSDEEEEEPSEPHG